MPTPAQEVLQSLQRQHAALFEKMGTVTDPKLGQAIMLESQEIVHRMLIAQNVVLKEAAAQVDEALAGVRETDKQLQADLQQITDAADFIGKVTKYLGFVDDVLDGIKKVAAFV